MKANCYPSKAEAIQDPAKGPENTNWETRVVNQERRCRAPQHTNDVGLAHPDMEELETRKDPGQQAGNACKENHVREENVGGIKGFPARELGKVERVRQVHGGIGLEHDALNTRGQRRINVNTKEEKKELTNFCGKLVFGPLVHPRDFATRFSLPPRSEIKDHRPAERLARQTLALIAERLKHCPLNVFICRHFSFQLLNSLLSFLQECA
jgi:hypothetical protein